MQIMSILGPSVSDQFWTSIRRLYLVLNLGIQPCTAWMSNVFVFTNINIEI